MPVQQKEKMQFDRGDVVWTLKNYCSAISRVGIVIGSTAGHHIVLVGTSKELYIARTRCLFKTIEQAELAIAVRKTHDSYIQR